MEGKKNRFERMCENYFNGWKNRHCGNVPSCGESLNLWTELNLWHRIRRNWATVFFLMERAIVWICFGSPAPIISVIRKPNIKRIRICSEASTWCRASQSCATKSQQSASFPADEEIFPLISTLRFVQWKNLSVKSPAEENGLLAFCVWRTVGHT